MIDDPSVYSTLWSLCSNYFLSWRRNKKFFLSSVFIFSNTPSCNYSYYCYYHNCSSIYILVLLKGKKWER